MIYKILVAVAASTIVLLGLLFFVDSKDGSACDQDSPSVAYARGLDDIELSNLYSEIRTLVDSGARLDRVPSNSKELPEALSHYRFQGITVAGPRTRIVLEGCMDTYVAITFDGISNSKKPAVLLSWGEGPTRGSRVLWTGGA